MHSFATGHPSDIYLCASVMRNHRDMALLVSLSTVGELKKTVRRRPSSPRGFRRRRPGRHRRRRLLLGRRRRGLRGLARRRHHVRDHRPDKANF